MMAELAAVAAPVHLLPATVGHLEAAVDGRLAELLGEVPTGWPEFPEAIPYELGRLRTTGQRPGWGMHFFLERDTDRLIGSGGYVSAPIDGAVEIGYEIAPAFRGRRLGEASAAALALHAFDRGAVRVRANTLAESTPSSRLLERLGFVRGPDASDPDKGVTWSWELSRP